MRIEGPAGTDRTEIILRSLANISETLERMAVIAAMGHEEFDRDDFLPRLAGVGALVQLGEQAKHLGSDFIERNPEPGYRKAKQRDFLSHNYEEVDWQVVWTSVAVSAPRSALAHAAAREKFESRVLDAGCLASASPVHLGRS